MRMPFVVGACLLALPASAQVVPERSIGVGVAVEAAVAAMEACAGRNFRVSVAVVDRGGTLKALVRADGAGPHTVSTAERKAYTSLTFRAPTAALAERVLGNPASAQLAQIDRIILLGGGVPIRAGDDVIGAMGVGGAPSGAIDEECANAGIAKIQDRLR
jgi:uncharacterized protein GlcG (DUF336 family)